MNRNHAFLNIIGAAALAAAVTTHASAQSVTTDPVGVVKKTIAAGTGSSHVITLLSLPMLDKPTDLTGKSVGTVSAFTADTISDDAAGWAAGELSQEASPRLVKITSGNAEGLVMLISTETQNTATTLTIDDAESSVIDLTAVGLAQGDSYCILNCDTLLSAFGTPDTSGVLGGTAKQNADYVMLLNEIGWRSYFYSTDSDEWVLVQRGFPAADNVPLKPDTGIIYARLGDTGLEVQLSGAVPTTDSLSFVDGSGVSFLGVNWPTDRQLQNSGIKDVPGWVADSDFVNSDYIILLTDLGWEKFWYDGTNWRRNVRGFPISDEYVIESPNSIMVVKRSATDNQFLSEANPYNFN